MLGVSTAIMTVSKRIIRHIPIWNTLELTMSYIFWRNGLSGFGATISSDSASFAASIDLIWSAVEKHWVRYKGKYLQPYIVLLDVFELLRSGRSYPIWLWKNHKNLTSYPFRPQIGQQDTEQNVQRIENTEDDKSNEIQKHGRGSLVIRLHMRLKTKILCSEY